MANLEVEVSITDTELFKGVVNILDDILKDERIPFNVRQEYVDRLNEVKEED